MKKSCSLLMAVFGILATGGFALGEAAKTQTSSRSMTELLAQGFEARSHQFYRCTAKPAEDNAVSCISIVMQKGAEIAHCALDRAHFMRPGPPMQVGCVVFK